jgi:hypothetical protein
MYLTELNEKFELIGIEPTRIYMGNEYDYKYFAHSIESDPGTVRFKLDGKYKAFICDVAVRTYKENITDFTVDFKVEVDGILLANLTGMHPGDIPQSIKCNIFNCNTLDLTTTVYGDSSQGGGVWLNPHVNIGSFNILGALNDIAIYPPENIIKTKNCIVTVIDPDFIPRLDTLLYTLFQYGNCVDTEIVVFAFGDIRKYTDIKHKYDFHVVPCELLSTFSFKIKTAALSMAQIISAENFIYLDADMFILDDLSCIFSMLDNIADDKILVTKETSIRSSTLAHALYDTEGVYYASPDDIKFLNMNEFEKQYNIMVNNGVYAGTRKSILALEAAVRSFLPNAAYWERFALANKIFWREQAIFNIALAKNNAAVPLSDLFNYQLNSKDVEIRHVAGKPLVYADGQKVKVLHFNGMGRSKYLALQDYYAMKASECNSDHLISQKNIISSVRNTKPDFDIDIWYSYIIYLNDLIHPKNVLVIDSVFGLGTFVIKSIMPESNITSIAKQLCEQSLSSDIKIVDVPTELDVFSPEYFDVICVMDTNCNSYLYTIILKCLELLNTDGQIIIKCQPEDVRELKKLQNTNKFKIVPLTLNPSVPSLWVVMR